MGNRCCGAEFEVEPALSSDEDPDEIRSKQAVTHRWVVVAQDCAAATPIVDAPISDEPEIVTKENSTPGDSSPGGLILDFDSTKDLGSSPQSGNTSSPALSPSTGRPRAPLTEENLAQHTKIVGQLSPEEYY